MRARLGIAQKKSVAVALGRGARPSRLSVQAPSECLHRRYRDAVCNDHGRLSADEFCRHPWNPVILIVGPAILDGDVLALDESGLVQALPERTDKVRRPGRHRRAEKTDHWHRLCCARAASGHAAAPPTSVMNSRLFTRSPRRRVTGSMWATQYRSPWRS